VELEIGVDRPSADRRLAAVADAVERLAEADALLVDARLDPVEGRGACEAERAEHRRREARALLVRPVDDLDRALRLDLEVVERAQDLEPGKQAEHAVELAARPLRVEMAADEHRRQAGIGPLAAQEHVAEPVDGERIPAFLGPALELVANLPVLVGERQAAQAAARGSD
jgi:hypothetical protein